jgi:hypothetical protein
MGFSFKLGHDLVRDAHEKQMSLSAFLETLDPTSGYPVHERNMDAFQRQLKRLDIRTRSDPGNGLLAHKFSRFFESDAAGTAEERSVLAYEWMRRTHMRYAAIRPRSQVMAGGMRNGVFSDDGVRGFPMDVPTSFIAMPPALDTELRYQVPAPSMLNYLVARTRLIEGEAEYALYLTDEVVANADAKEVRIEQFAEIPAVRFQTAETATRVKKYGRRLDMSYEQMRRLRIDTVEWAIIFIATKADREKEDQAVDVLVNGDGNSGTAATSVNGTTLDSASANKLTLKMWIAWRLKKWTRPYTPDVVVGRADGLIDIFLLNAGSSNLPQGAYIANSIPGATQYVIPRATLDRVVLIDNDTVAANVLLGVDSRFTLEMLMEVGSDIQEAENVARAQYRSIMFTQNVGFDVIVKGLNQSLAYTL